MRQDYRQDEMNYNTGYETNGNVYDNPQGMNQESFSETPHKKKSKKGIALKITSGVLALGLCTGLAINGVGLVSKIDKILGAVESHQQSADTASSDDTNLASNEQDSIATSAALPVSTQTDGVAQIAENVMPSIVAINCTSYVTSSFFGQQYQQEQQGSGSGIIIGDNQDEVLIVTNNHVVEGEQSKVSVQFCDETTADATIKGTDPDSDLAVVAVKLSDLSSETKNNIKIATLGNSDETKVGEVAVAIGNALGYGQSVTVGYISAKDRTIEIEDSADTMKLLQTDAAINPGNSGGALINAKGEIIGINSAKYSATMVEGMGYAIPITDALPIIKALMNSEKVETQKAYFGIIGAAVDENASRLYNMPVGVYVKEITENSPAAQAGIQAGDIITKFDGNTVSSMEDLQKMIYSSKVGAQIKVTVQKYSRGSYTEREITVTLGTTDDKDE